MFAPGDEVVCVDVSPRSESTPQWYAENFLVLGKHYVVTRVEVVDYKSRPQCTCVHLEGVSRRNGGREFPFAADRFRPVRRESIEIFRAMCVSTKPLVEV